MKGANVAASRTFRAALASSLAPTHGPALFPGRQPPGGGVAEALAGLAGGWFQRRSGLTLAD